MDGVNLLDVLRKSLGNLLNRLLGSSLSHFITVAVSLSWTKGYNRLEGYNRLDSILRTLKSVINQSCCPLDIVIIDDGSQDDTEDILLG